MVQTSSVSKNIWVAASDGDIERVQHLIENEGLSPNVKDANSYTPMHAAASYAHLELLEYLISKGGDINLPDDDGETPLFVVESKEVAQWLLEHGAELGWTNEEGLNAADVLEDDHPELSAYLRSLLPSDPASALLESQAISSSDPSNPALTSSTGSSEGISQLALENYTAAQSSALMERAQEIMRAAAEDGTDPDEKLRELVENAVREGMLFGGELGADAGVGEQIGQNDEERKRARE